MSEPGERIMSEAWVLPVGHYLGPYFPGPGTPMECHRVRLGNEIVKLANDAELLVWALAHGLPGAVPHDSDRVWTRAAVTAVASQRGDADLTDTFDSLVSVGALVEVGPDAVDPAVFARRHRFQPLLSGLGVGPSRPDRVMIGLIGEEPAAVVTVQVFELWQWAPRAGSLWELGQYRAAAASVLGDRDDGVPGLLRRLHTLLAAGCGYLDLSAEAAASESTTATST
jgi:hypothetical protein